MTHGCVDFSPTPNRDKKKHRANINRLCDKEGDIANYLRVIAPKTGGAYYRGCRRPEPDFDETRSRRSFWAKTKFETHLFEIRAHAYSAQGPPKGGIFDPPKKPFFGQIFFLSNCREMFAMGFLVVFIPEMSSL